MTICLSHGGQSIYSGSSPSKDLLVATIDGVVFLHREEQGSPWLVRRKALEGRHIIALVVEPNAPGHFCHCVPPIIVILSAAR